MDFGYPGGPKVDKLAKEGKPTIEFPKTIFKDCLDFSFSGIKTAVINYNHKNRDNEINKADLCCSFQHAVTEVLMENVKKAINITKLNTVTLAGGVSSNSHIREEFLKLEGNNIKVYMPELNLCTDNAAMIAAAGYYRFLNGEISNLDLNAVPNLKL